VVKIKEKTKKVIFELEVKETFNPYKFFQIFKKIQYKGFFKDIIRVSRLDAQGKAEEIVENITQIAREETFILSEIYGVK
jgi:hypothetical protein